jgi:hypothetical protein
MPIEYAWPIDGHQRRRTARRKTDGEIGSAEFKNLCWLENRFRAISQTLGGGGRSPTGPYPTGRSSPAIPLARVRKASTPDSSASPTVAGHHHFIDVEVVPALRLEHQDCGIRGTYKIFYGPMSDLWLPAYWRSRRSSHGPARVTATLIISGA